MKTLGARVLILIVAAVSLGTLLMYFGGFVSGLTTGLTMYAMIGLLIVVYVAILGGVWKSFDVMDRGR